MKKTLPSELLATRPSAEDEWHPSHGPNLGPPPPKFTPAVLEAIVNGVRKGNRPEVAASIAGIPKNTFYRWMQQGREGHPHLWELSQAVDQALAQLESQAIASIAGETGAFELDPENAKWFLERRFSEAYSKDAATKVNAMLKELFERIQTVLPEAITAEMVGMNLFEIFISAANGQSLAVERTTFTLNAKPEEDIEESE